MPFLGNLKWLFICFGFILACGLISWQFVSVHRSPSSKIVTLSPGADGITQSQLILSEIRKLKMDIAKIDSEMRSNDISKMLDRKFAQNARASRTNSNPNPAPVDLSKWKKWKNQNLVDSIGRYGVDQCQKHEKVYFLKTSKTGSTTMANILMRFGFRRPGTNYLLGETSNAAMFFINQYMSFNEDLCFLGRDLPDRPRFDISYIHMRYNKTAVDNVMHEDTFKITILRDPMTNFMSSWKYYNGLTVDLREKVNRDTGIDDWEKNPDFYKEMDQFLTKPWGYLESFPFEHSAYFFTANPQFLFFGKPSYLLKSDERRLEKLVDSWLFEIAEDFDHVLILEDLDRSLAVMMLKLCWDISDVLHLRLNSMRKDGKTLYSSSEKALRKFNWADFRLYEFFRKKLQREIETIGSEKIQLLAEEIASAADQLSKECLKQEESHGWISSPIIKNEMRHNQTCTLMIKDISTYIELDHVVRWKSEYPEWRMDPKKVVRRKTKGKEMPDFCKAGEGFSELMEKKEPEFRTFLNYKTNEYDIRNFIPEYLREFAKPLTTTERQDPKFHRILN